jgi:hypothetical protein
VLLVVVFCVDARSFCSFYENCAILYKFLVTCKWRGKIVFELSSTIKLQYVRTYLTSAEHTIRKKSYRTVKVFDGENARIVTRRVDTFYPELLTLRETWVTIHGLNYLFFTLICRTV